MAVCSLGRLVMRWIERRRNHWLNLKRGSDRDDAQTALSPTLLPPNSQRDKEPNLVEPWTLDHYITYKVPELYPIVSRHCDRVNKTEFGNELLLHPTLVLSIIYCESAGNPYASRYEPKFFSWLMSRIKGTKIRPSSGVSVATEEVMRATSFGLMQILGQTARELGYSKLFLTQLVEPDINIFYGIKYLVSRMKRFHTKEEYIAAYNSGTPKYRGEVLVNQDYVSKVCAVQGQIKKALA